MKIEGINLTFFLLEGVRHDGICSGNQQAVLSLESKAVNPAEEATGGLSSSASQRDQPTLLPDRSCFHHSFILLAFSRMTQDAESDWCPSLRADWQLRSWRDEAVFSAEGRPVCVWQRRSSSGEAACLSLFSRMGMLLERQARQRG